MRKTLITEIRALTTGLIAVDAMARAIRLANEAADEIERRAE